MQNYRLSFRFAAPDSRTMPLLNSISSPHGILHKDVHRTKKTVLNAKAGIVYARVATHGGGFFRMILYSSFIANMRILLTTILLSGFMCFAKAQAPTAQALVNMFRCTQPDCANKALAADNYVRVMPDSVKDGLVYYIYKPEKDAGNKLNSIIVDAKKYNSTYITNVKSNYEDLVTGFQDLGYESAGMYEDLELEGKMVDIWKWAPADDYTILVTILFYKEEGKYVFSIVSGS